MSERFYICCGVDGHHIPCTGVRCFNSFIYPNQNFKALDCSEKNFAALYLNRSVRVRSFYAPKNWLAI